MYSFLIKLIYCLIFFSRPADGREVQQKTSKRKREVKQPLIEESAPEQNSGDCIQENSHRAKKTKKKKTN